MKPWKPGKTGDLSRHGIPGKKLQSYDHEQERTAEPQEIVREHI
jgi:hypothetical protein